MHLLEVPLPSQYPICTPFLLCVKLMISQSIHILVKGLHQALLPHHSDIGIIFLVFWCPGLTLYICCYILLLIKKNETLVYQLLKVYNTPKVLNSPNTLSPEGIQPCLHALFALGICWSVCSQYTFLYI